jgi:hypothetical protein
MFLHPLTIGRTSGALNELARMRTCLFVIGPISFLKRRARYPYMLGVRQLIET